MERHQYQQHQLPSYDDLSGSPSPPLIDNPPTYDEARASKPHEMKDLPSLILVDGHLIYAECQSQLPLYSLPPPGVGARFGKAGSRLTQEIIKHIYRLSAPDGEGYLQPQVARLYDIAFEQHKSYFNTGRSALHLLSGAVDIAGDMEKPGSGVASLSFRNHSQVPNLLLVGCEVVVSRKDLPRGKMLLRAAQRREQFVSNSYEIEWRDGAGKLLAIETMPRRANPDTPSSPGDGCGEGWRGLPRLEIKAAMATRQFDFLVTCWMARFRKIESIYNA